METPFYARRIIRIVIISACLLSGLFYLSAQRLYTGTFADPFFVFLVISATAILMIGLVMIYRYSAQRSNTFFKMINEHPHEEWKKFHARLYNTKLMTATGIAYGAFISTAPFVLNAWEENIILRSLLAVFLFNINFATGVAFFSLTRYLLFAVRFNGRTNVDLWQRETDAAEFIFGFSSRITLLSSLYITMCISSILFSVLPLSNFIIAYTVFAGLIITSCLVIPFYPIVQKLTNEKNHVLKQVNTELQFEFKKVFTNKFHEHRADLSRMECLVRLHDKIEQIDVLPFRWKILKTLLSILFLQAIPWIIEQLVVN